MKIKRLKTIIEEFYNPDILGMYYNGRELFIDYVANSNQIFEIKFKNVFGFRCLDEEDLTSYWKNKDLTQNWIVEILEGGWLDAEYSIGNCFKSKTTQRREFLILSDDDCLSILSSDEPEIKNKSTRIN